MMSTTRSWPGSSCTWLRCLTWCRSLRGRPLQVGMTCRAARSMYAVHATGSRQVRQHTLIGSNSPHVLLVVLSRQLGSHWVQPVALQAKHVLPQLVHVVVNPPVL